MFPQQPNNNYRTTFDGENISEKPCFSTKLLNVTLYYCQERVAIHFIIIIIIFIIIGLAQLLFLPLSVFEEINGRRKEKLLQKHESYTFQKCQITLLILTSYLISQFLQKSEEINFSGNHFLALSPSRWHGPL